MCLLAAANSTKRQQVSWKFVCSSNLRAYMLRSAAVHVCRWTRHMSPPLHPQMPGRRCRSMWLISRRRKCRFMPIRTGQCSTAASWQQAVDTRLTVPCRQLCTTGSAARWLSSTHASVAGLVHIYPHINGCSISHSGRADTALLHGAINGSLHTQLHIPDCIVAAPGCPLAAYPQLHHRYPLTTPPAPLLSPAVT